MLSVISVIVIGIVVMRNDRSSEWVMGVNGCVKMMLGGRVLVGFIVFLELIWVCMLMCWVWVKVMFCSYDYDWVFVYVMMLCG